MSDLQFFWAIQPDVVRWFVRGLLVLFLGTLIGIIKSAGCLYNYRVALIELDKLATGDFNPDLLAKAALANRLAAPEDSGKTFDISATNGVNVQKAANNLRAAEARFSYLWEMSLARVQLGKGACALILLISLLMIACSTTAVYDEYRGAYSLTDPWRVVLTFVRLTELLALGGSFCMPLYLTSSFLEWRLRLRRARWQYLCATILQQFSERG